MSDRVIFARFTWKYQCFLTLKRRSAKFIVQLLNLAVINVNFGLKKDEKYCLQVFSKECKYIEKELIRNISEGTELYSSDPDEK